MMTEPAQMLSNREYKLIWQSQDNVQQSAIYQTPVAMLEYFDTLTRDWHRLKLLYIRAVYRPVGEWERLSENQPEWRKSKK